ncbi:hypothetical protein [Streptomyces chryseus]
MTRTQRIVLTSATAVAGLALLAISVYLGLDRTEKLASILSAVVGIASLSVSIYQLTRSGSSSPTAPPPSQSQRSGDNSTNIQSGGNINIGNNNKLGGDR